MKKSVISMLAMFFVSLCFAQKMEEKNVPANVKASFQKKYPTATDVIWDKEDGKYEVSFNLNKLDNSLLMDIQGNILQTEVEIEIDQLPKGILDYVKTHYAGQQAKEGAKITDASGTVTYEVGIKNMDLIFNSNGQFIKSEKDND